MVDGQQRVFLFLVAVIMAGLVAIATLAGRSGGDRCEEWQAAYEEANAIGGTGTLQFINEGPMAELDARRPDGCEIPG